MLVFTWAALQWCSGDHARDRTQGHMHQGKYCTQSQVPRPGLSFQEIRNILESKENLEAFMQSACYCSELWAVQTRRKTGREMGPAERSPYGG